MGKAIFSPCYNPREYQVKMSYTHVSDLTVDELKALACESVEWALVEILSDPDKGYVHPRSRPRPILARR
jgi:hypothetical protein